MRTKKIMLNMLADIIPYLLIGLLGLIKIKFLVQYVGDVGNGYYQVINQIISYVFLAQCGFTDAVIYKLFKPFADNNKDDINALYTGSRKIFKVIGGIILGIIIVVTIGLFFLYSFEDGYRNSVLLSFFIIAVSYLIPFFGKRQAYQAVVSASQERYTYSFAINMIKLTCDFLTIISIYIFRNLESIAITIAIVKVLEEYIIRRIVEKKYPWLKETKRSDTSPTKMIKDLAWYQVGYLVNSNTDSILLLAFLGPIMVSIYTSYNVILRFLEEIISRINQAAVYSFGNVFAKKEDNIAYSLYKEFLTLFIMVSFIFSFSFMLGMRSFVDIWINNAEYVLSYETMILFTGILFVTTLYFPLFSMINANGLFKDNKNHVMISAIINLALSLILINFMGINGLLLGTIISLITNIILKCILAKKKIFTDTTLTSLLTPYFLCFIAYIVLAFLLKGIESYIFSIASGWIMTLLLIFISFIILSIVIVSLMYIFNKNTRLLFKRLISLIKGKLKKA